MPYRRTVRPEESDAPACVHLRSKTLIVAGELDPENVDDLGSTPCWCNLTQHVLGPDEGAVERKDCVSGRDCYRTVL